MLSTKVWDDVEEARVGALWVIFQDTGINVQVSLLVLHPRCPYQVVLFPTPVPETAEEVIGQEAVDGVSDDVNVHRVIYLKPAEVEKMNMSSVQERLWYLTDVSHESCLLMFGKPGFVVDVRGDQCELLPFSQDAQQQDDGATATLPHTIVHHPAGEWQWFGGYGSMII